MQWRTRSHRSSSGSSRFGPRSGYEIKQTVDRSTRFFWAASYGQIYPELRRLEQRGPDRGRGRPDRRPRPARLPADERPAARSSLRWLTSEGDLTVELRDESLLRLFFADALPREDALQLLEGRRRGHEQFLAALREIDALPGEDPPFVDLVLQWGIDFNEWGVKWCTEQLERLSATTAS